MPKKEVKKSKKTGMHQKQVVNINITNPKRKAKRVKSKPKTNPRKLYPAEVQSHNSGVVLPFHHQFYIPPTDKSFPQIEELINTHRDGNLLQIKQSNDLMNQLEGSHKLINQLANYSMKEKSPKKLYEQLMQEHLDRNKTQIINHVDENGDLWEERVPKKSLHNSNKKNINSILKDAGINQEEEPAQKKVRGRPKKVLIPQPVFSSPLPKTKSKAPVQPLGEALPSAPALIPAKQRGRPTLTEEQKAQNKADRLAKQNSGAGAGAGVSEYKNDEEQYINAKKLIAPHIKNYSKKLTESNKKLNSLFADYEAENLGNIGAPIQAEVKAQTTPVAKRTRHKKK
jgi:hypothetical protein